MREATVAPVALVIDVNVGVMAAGRPCDDPAADLCADFLEAVLERRHPMLFTPAIQAEWERHDSRFAMRWLKAMAARGLLPAPGVSRLHELDQALEAVCASAPADAQAIRRRTQEDRHLVEAALASDGRVASLDERARRSFGRLAGHYERLAKLVWVNPGNDGEQAPIWLHAGCPLDPHRMLGA